jgi:TatD DNase family protein
VPLFDAHAHLAAPDFAGDLPAVLDRAEAAGLSGVLTVGETPADAERILDLAARYPMIKPAVGLFPTILDRTAAATVMAIARDNAHALVAIGEVGLDRWAVKTEAEWRIQEEILAEFVGLSRELDLPLNVHSRSAGRHAIAFLKRSDARRVLLHAFDGKAATAVEGADAGYYFSIPPSVVRSPQKQKLVQRLPLDCLLLETDSPVLGPDSTARNEPANILVACRAVAEIKGVSLDTVARVTTDNARRLFPRAFA